MAQRKTPDPRTVTLAKQITEIALKRGISQNKLSAAAGIKPNQWSALLHGRSGISDEKLHKADAFLGRSGDEKLRTLQGESFDYDPELHRVVGVVDGFRRKRRR